MMPISSSFDLKGKEDSYNYAPKKIKKKIYFLSCLLGDKQVGTVRRLKIRIGIGVANRFRFVVSICRSERFGAVVADIFTTFF